MSNRIQVRRDTAASWTSANPVLATGELGYEIDTKKTKIGDGAAVWSALPYQPNSASVAATYVSFQYTDGSPVVGKHVIITVNPSTFDIEDIRTENL